MLRTLGLIVVVALVAVSGTLMGLYHLGYVDADDLGSIIESGDEDPYAELDVTPTPGDSVGGESVPGAIHDAVNAVRDQRDIEPIEANETVQSAAQSIAHDIRDHYSDRTLPPISITYTPEIGDHLDTDSVGRCTEFETLTQLSYVGDQSDTLVWADDSHDSAEDIAVHVLDNWLDDAHDEMTDSDWIMMGAGAVVTDDDLVYVTLILCHDVIIL